MQELIDKFNECFNGDAIAEIKDDRLEITVGTVTQIISLPSVVGSQAISTDQ